ncbi:hypothetical protein, partial [Mesorhizobium sp.]|uniref:hypothetical protein n=1 Tax=Mesorhizobium sp. TaxID=1871066 RepID=UPI00344C9CF3
RARARRRVKGFRGTPARHRHQGHAVRRQRLYAYVDQWRFRPGWRRLDRGGTGVPEGDGDLITSESSRRVPPARSPARGRRLAVRRQAAR